MSYQNRKEYMRKYQREWIAKRRQDFFKDKICADCKTTENLQLHHIDPSIKVDHKIWSWREERRFEEIAKCKVVCAKCHYKYHKPTPRRGVENHASKLTEVQVLEIRKEAASGDTHGVIAKRYGVFRTTIQKVVSRTTWKHI